MRSRRSRDFKKLAVEATGERKDERILFEKKLRVTVLLAGAPAKLKFNVITTNR